MVVCISPISSVSAVISTSVVEMTEKRIFDLKIRF